MSATVELLALAPADWRALGADPDGLRWGSYLVTDPERRMVIGVCAYQSPPDADGAVEIAYYTFPSHEGRGYATAMAARLTSPS